MPFTLIKGQFRIVGLSPDGDSIRFAADDPGRIDALPGGRPQHKPTAQLRLEAIDALETHYAGRHQPERWARAATEALLDFVGVTDIRWDSKHSTIVSAKDGTRGYILAREREKYGRPVAFVFAGDTDEEDGATVFLDADRMGDSYNLRALREGLAYPTYYTSLFHDLREACTAAVAEAREAGRGLWPDDRTTDGFEATSLAVLMDEVAILPKLFRRLSDYMAANGSAEGFKQALAMGEDAVWDLRTQSRTHLDTFVEQDGLTIRLTREPEELVFDELPQQPARHFARMVGAPDSDIAAAG